MEFLNFSISQVASNFVPTGQIIGVEEGEKIARAFTLLRLNPGINHLVVFKDKTTKPIGVLDRKKLYSEFKNVKNETISAKCRKDFTFIDTDVETNPEMLKYYNFFKSDDKIIDVISNMRRKHEDRNSERLDYAIVLKADKEISTIITYKDILKLAAKNLTEAYKFTEDMPYTHADEKLRSSSATKDEYFIDVEDRMGDFHSMPIFENDKSFNLYGIIFRNSITMNNMELKVSDPALMTSRGRFPNCKINLGQELKTVLMLYIDYPEFTSVPVYDDKDLQFLGLMSYIDIFKWFEDNK